MRFYPPPSKILTAHAASANDLPFASPTADDSGYATPASPNGTTEAEPYEYSKLTLTGKNDSLFSVYPSAPEITGYSYKFTSPVDGENYGVVEFDTENAPYIKYTPNAEAAGKTIEFFVTAQNSAGSSADSSFPVKGITFTITVRNQPTDASNNADLSSLTYTVDGGEPIDVPNFSSDVMEYEVELPVDTEERLPITLQGVLDDENASITSTIDTKTDYISSTAKITVTAENESTEKTYTVNFKIKAPNTPYCVFDPNDGTIFEDGDTIKVIIGEEKFLHVSIGSGNTGVVSASIKSADMEKLWVSQAFWGLYPNVFTAVKLNIKDYEQTKLTVSFYDVDVSRGETGDPVETIVLTIKSVEEPKKSSGSSHSLEETTGTKKDNNKPEDKTEEKPEDKQNPEYNPNADGVKQGFDDVSSFAWYSEAVEFVSENNIMNGTSDRKFSPEDILTRGMSAQIFYNMEGCPDASSLTINWYDNAVNWILANNIASGYSGGNFGAESPITTEQFTVILYNYAKFKGLDVSTAASAGDFKDSAEISHWAVNAVEWAIGKGILNGSDGYLNPKAQITRAQAAQMLMLFNK